MGFAVCLFSLLCSICLIFIDKCMDGQAGNEGSLLEGDETINLASTIELSYIYWLITGVCLTLYGGFLPFNNIEAGFLTKTYFRDYTKEEAAAKAGIYMAIPFFIGAFLVPVLGYLIDQIGKRAYFMCLASISGLLCFSMFYCLPPIVPIVSLGITYSLFAVVIWPAIALVVDKKLIGLAYGLTTSIQNFGLAVFPVVVASIYTSSQSYYFVWLIYLDYGVLPHHDVDFRGFQCFDYLGG